MNPRLNPIEKLPFQNSIDFEYFGLSCDLNGMSFSCVVKSLPLNYKLTFWLVVELKYGNSNDFFSDLKLEERDFSENLIYEVDSNWADQFNLKRCERKNELKDSQNHWLNDDSFTDSLGTIQDLKHYFLFFSDSMYLNLLATGYKLENILKEDAIDHFYQKTLKTN